MTSPTHPRQAVTTQEGMIGAAYLQDDHCGLGSFAADLHDLHVTLGKNVQDYFFNTF